MTNTTHSSVKSVRKIIPQFRTTRTPLSFIEGPRVRNFALLKKSNQIQIILLIHAMPSHVFPERKITAQII